MLYILFCICKVDIEGPARGCDVQLLHETTTGYLDPGTPEIH